MHAKGKYRTTKYIHPPPQKTTPKTTYTQTTHDPKFDPWAGIGPFLKKHMIRAGVKPKVKLFHKPKKPQEPLALS